MMWRCESLSPGITVRPLALMTVVSTPRCRRTSSLGPAATILPSLMASAWTNPGTPLVAIFALWMMLSAAMRASLWSYNSRAASRRPTSVRSLFVLRRARNEVLGKRRRRRTVHHRVGVLDADTVCAVMTLDDVHDGVV